MFNPLKYYNAFFSFFSFTIKCDWKKLLEKKNLKYFAKRVRNFVENA